MSAKQGPSPHKLVTLEAGRFFAAAAVVLFHYGNMLAELRGAPVFGDAFRGGHAGVPYFFVLSGFVIYHAHRGEVGHPSAIRRFALKRAIRLLPMFWAVSLAMLAGFLAVPALGGERSLSAAGIVADLLLLPHSGAVLSISWTLRHEAVFYLLFALALWWGPGMFWIVAAWIAVSLANAALSSRNDLLGSWSIISSALNLGFGLGIVIAWLKPREAIGPPRIWIAAGGVSLLLLWVAEWMLGHGKAGHFEALGPVTGTCAYLVAAAMLVYGLVKDEEQREAPRPGLWRVLGGSSYLLYLVHQPLGSVAIRAVRPLRAMSPELAFLLLTATAIAAAIAAHLLVERPILAWLSARARGGARPQAAPERADG